MTAFINTIDKLGDETAFFQILSKTITEFKDNIIKVIGWYAFYKCGSLEIVDLLNVETIEDLAFRYCSKLKALVLRSTDIVTLSGGNCFLNTPIGSGTGYIYVPRAFLSDTDSTMDYRQATNWSRLQFRALEDYTVDGTVTGELDLSKI